MRGARVALTDLPNDILPLIVQQLCGGESNDPTYLPQRPVVHDISLWKHACRLAQTCRKLAQVVVDSAHCDDAVFCAEYVGPDVPEEPDPFKDSWLRVNRGIWNYEPLVEAEFWYGAVANDKYVYSLYFAVPLLLEDVMRLFYKPPGWRPAAQLALSGRDAPPFSACFPMDKYPETPERLRLRGKIKFMLRQERETPIVDACGEPDYDESKFDLSHLLPSDVQLMCTCSTGLEEFGYRRIRAHYLDDLELGLCGVFSGKLLRNPLMQSFMEKLQINPEEPPDLYYRLPPHARRLAGYPFHDHLALDRMLNPPVESDGEEEWDPNERKRRYRTSERMKATCNNSSCPTKTIPWATRASQTTSFSCRHTSHSASPLSQTATTPLLHSTPTTTAATATNSLTATRKSPSHPTTTTLKSFCKTIK